MWDAHACFPLRPDADLSELSRYKESGVDFVSLNVGMDMDPVENVIQVLAHFRKYIASHPDEYVLALSTDEVRAAKAAGKLAVAFDLEGSEPLLGNPDLVSFYYDLGVRQMLLAYNKDNRAGGGCMQGKIGLTDFGKDVIAEMNRVGMIVDLTHMGRQATLEACAASTAPVIFSHSNANGVHDHVRNISDAQIRACAASGGVVGVNGVGVFLGGAESEILVDHIEYVIDLVGPEHVGVGLDYVIDKQEIIDYVAAHPDAFPAGETADYLAFIEPEQFPTLSKLLHKKGYSDRVIGGVLGGNFLRVAEAVWQ